MFLGIGLDKAGPHVKLQNARRRISLWNTAAVTASECRSCLQTYPRDDRSRHSMQKTMSVCFVMSFPKLYAPAHECFVMASLSPKTPCHYCTSSGAAAFPGLAVGHVVQPCSQNTKVLGTPMIYGD